jgi:uncharacterized protein (DUF362 family)
MTARHSASDLTRREALVTLAAPALAASACRARPPYDAAAFVRPATSAVAVLAARTYAVDFADVIGRGLATLRLDVRGLRVLLKPNMVEYRPGEAVNTDPRVVAGAAQALLRAGARQVVVGEGPGHRRDTEYLLASTGLLDVLRDERLPYVDLNQDDVRVTPLRSRFTGAASLALPVSVLDADLVVSMPKLKTHHWAGMTASMKNLFGVVPGAVYGWPKNPLHILGIEPSIVDLAATVRPGLAIVDAVVGMEGDGPIMGTPRALGCVVLGTDLVAVDATCARLIGIEPARLGYLRAAGRFLGNTGLERIEQRGEPLERVATRFGLIDRWQRLTVPLTRWERTLVALKGY